MHRIGQWAIENDLFKDINDPVPLFWPHFSFDLIRSSARAHCLLSPCLLRRGDNRSVRSFHPRGAKHTKSRRSARISAICAGSAGLRRAAAPGLDCHPPHAAIDVSHIDIYTSHNDIYTSRGDIYTSHGDIDLHPTLTSDADLIRISQISVRSYLNHIKM